MSSPGTGQSNLVAAIIRDDVETVEALLQLPATCAEINEWNFVSKTPLCIAIERGNCAIVRILLQSGADVSSVSYSQTTCAYEMPLTTAVRLKEDKIIELLLEYIDHIAEDSDIGKTALHWAATHGDVSLAENLVNRGAYVNKFGPSRNSALHYATISDHTNMVRWLLEKDAAVTLNDEGRSPLHIAAVRGSIDIVRLLLDTGCPITSRDNFNFTPLALACLRSHMPVVMRLVEGGIDVDLSDGLRRAAESSHVDVMRYLLSDQRCNIDDVNEQGETALSIAAIRGQFPAAKFLINAGARMDTVDIHGYTPIYAALMSDRYNIAAELVINGAPVHSFPVAVLSYSPLKVVIDLTDPVLIKCMLLAGCCDKDGKLASSLHDTDSLRMAATPAHGQFVRNTYLMRETLKWLKMFACQPLTLKQLSRIAIRKQLCVASSGCSIFNRISLLPLPIALLSYLCFDNVKDE